MLAAERYDGAEPVNLGAGREITIRELTETIGRLVGYEGSVRWDASQPDGQPRRMLDTSRARDLFGFEAQTSFEDGLKPHKKLSPGMKHIGCRKALFTKRDSNQTQPLVSRRSGRVLL